MVKKEEKEETSIITTESTQEEIDIVEKLGASLSTDAKPTHARYLWYGDYGEGKTYLLGQFNELLKKHGTRGCFGMDFDGAMSNVLKSAGIEMPIKTYLGRSGYSTFEADIGNFYKQSHGFGALVIDPLTAFERVVMNQAMLINPIDRNLKGKLMTLPHGMPSVQDFGVEFEVINNILQFLQNVSLHMHVVMTAHIIERHNPITNVVEFLPAISGKKMPSAIGRWFNEVWWIHGEMKQRNIERIAQTASYNKYKCKSQVYGMPHSLPAIEALEKTLAAYTTGNVRPVKAPPEKPSLGEQGHHPEDLLAQPAFDEPDSPASRKERRVKAEEDLLKRMEEGRTGVTSTT